MHKWNRALSVSVLCAGAFLSPCQCLASPNAPPERVIRTVVIDPRMPSTVYAGTEGGVYKTIDAGGHWQPMNSGLPPAAAQVLAIDPKVSTTAYVAMGAGPGGPGAVYKTTDGGSTWSLVLSPGSRASAIVVDPAHPDTLYVGTMDGLTYRTMDGGAHWTRGEGGLPTYQGKAMILALALAPQDSSTLYAATWLTGIYKSVDGGTTWQEANEGLGRWTITNLTVDLKAPNTVYTVVGPRVYRTTGGRDKWAAVGDLGRNADALDIVIDPTEPRTLYVVTKKAGLLKSKNGGESWQKVPGRLVGAGVSCLAIDPAKPTTLYAGTEERGIFKSTDGGQSWVGRNGGLPGYTGVLSLAINPKAPRTVYAGTTSGGVLRTRDGGEHWTAINAGLPPNASVYSLALDAASKSGATLYAGTDDRVYKSTNGGLNWRPASAGLPAKVQIIGLVIDPRNALTLYTAGGSPASGGGFFRSSDGGRHWTPRNGGLPDLRMSALVVDPAAPGTLYAGVSGGVNLHPKVGGVYKTTDAGISWAPANGNLLRHTAVRQLALDPLHAGTVYAAVDEAVLAKTTTGGATWQQKQAEPFGRLVVQAIAIDPKNPATLYIGVQTRGIFKSVDGGAVWKPANVGLESTDVRAIAIDPTDPATLYAGTGSGSGPARIFKSTDGGATWAPSDVDRRAKASNPTGVDPRERKDPRVTNEDVAAQILKDLATIDERMAQVFQALRGVLPEMNRAELVAQKRSWGERRDSACRMVERDLHPEKWRQQIRLDPLKLLCLLHVSRNRLEEMETALKSKRLPNVLPERSAKGVLGDTRKYLISEEAGGFKNSRGRWYFEVQVRPGEISQATRAELGMGFWGVERFGGLLIRIQKGDTALSPARFGFALDAGIGKVYTRLNGRWIGGAPGSAEGMDVLSSAASFATVASSVPLDELLLKEQIQMNFGDQPFAFPPPAGYTSITSRKMVP